MSQRAPYAEELRSRREAAGLTQKQLAEKMLVHPSLVAHWEAGRRKPSYDDAKRLDRVLNTGGTFERFLRDNPFAQHFDRAAQAEQAAIRIEEYAPVYVPGLLQTEAYARGVFIAARMHWAEEDLDERVVNRLKRAEILTGKLPEVGFILSEAVLRLPVGGPEVMAEQIAHIIALVRARRIRVQVVPLAQGVHAAMGSMLSLMKFADAPDMAYVEGLHTGNVMDADAPDDVQRCRDAYDSARAAALHPDASLHLLETVMEEYRSYARNLQPQQQRLMAQVELQRRG
ncbi:helix-turn-helix transcriptional regulator [Streptomyces sp. SM12]|uniref:helix-turn-helix domain-containing protein n=1 Tax=Streptomyces sp. SM12 TaxID=1071602 RepID=UPI0015E1B8BA|nr:helix-turn-helix transcriptional regulator [Streptomyces sp. SM12]